jgi:hypothetical protein
MSDYPCQECGQEGRGPGAHRAGCSYDPYGNGQCELCDVYLYRDEVGLCKKCAKDDLPKDVMGKFIHPGAAVVVADHRKVGSLMKFVQVPGRVNAVDEHGVRVTWNYREQNITRADASRRLVVIG